MEECAPQNWWFFIRYMKFTNTFVYSVVYSKNVVEPVLGRGVSITFGAPGGGCNQPPGGNTIHDEK